MVKEVYRASNLQAWFFCNIYSSGIGYYYSKNKHCFALNIWKYMEYMETLTFQRNGNANVSIYIKNGPHCFAPCRLHRLCRAVPCLVASSTVPQSACSAPRAGALETSHSFPDAGAAQQPTGIPPGISAASPNRLRTQGEGLQLLHPSQMEVGPRKRWEWC